MSMKKKLKISGTVLLGALIIVIFFLCYKAGVHMADRKSQAQVSEIQEPTAEPFPVELQEPTAAPLPSQVPVSEEKKYTLRMFEDNLSEGFDKKQIKQIKKAAVSYLRNSTVHQNVEMVTCTKYYDRSQTRNQIYGYLQLDDGGLLQYTYDFDYKEAKIMETAVTLQVLESRERQEEEAEQARLRQEEEDRKKEQLAQEIFNRGEASVQPATTRNNLGQTQQRNPITYNYIPDIDYQDEIEEEQIHYDTFSEEEITDGEAVLEEEIPEDVFSDEEGQ